MLEKWIRCLKEEFTRFSLWVKEMLLWIVVPQRPLRALCSHSLFTGRVTMSRNNKLQKDNTYNGGDTTVG